MSEAKKILKTYERELQFSKYHLDDAVENQPVRFDKYNQLYVVALSKLEVLQRDWKERKAELDGQIRAAAAEGDTDVLVAEFGIHKVTENAITNAIESHDAIKGLNRKISDAKYEVNTLSGIVEAFQQRRSMIKYCCELAVMSYFGDIEFVRKQREEIHEKVAQTTKLPRRKRRVKDGKD